MDTNNRGEQSNPAKAMRHAYDEGYAAGLREGRKGFTVDHAGEIKHAANSDIRGVLLMPRDIEPGKLATAMCNLCQQVLDQYGIPANNFAVSIVSPAALTGDPLEMNCAVHWRNHHRVPEPVPGNPEE